MSISLTLFDYQHLLLQWSFHILQAPHTQLAMQCLHWLQTTSCLASVVSRWSRSSSCKESTSSSVNLFKLPIILENTLIVSSLKRTSYCNMKNISVPYLVLIDLATPTNNKHWCLHFFLLRKMYLRCYCITLRWFSFQGFPSRISYLCSSEAPKAHSEATHITINYLGLDKL